MWRTKCQLRKLESLYNASKIGTVFQHSFYLRGNSPECSINRRDNCIVCILVLGSICSQTINCTSRGDENAICMNGTCSCTYGYFPNSTRNKCHLSKRDSLIVQWGQNLWWHINDKLQIHLYFHHSLCIKTITKLTMHHKTFYTNALTLMTSILHL